MFQEPAKTCQLSGSEQKLADWMKILLLVVAVLTGSSLLVHASVQVLGNTLLGWSKAILLEAGIIILALSRCESWKEMLITKAALIVMIGLSFLVLHTGVERDRTRELKALASDDSELAQLLVLREIAMTDLKGLGPNYKTRRQQLRLEIEGYSADIRSLKDSLQQSAGVSVVQMQNHSEFGLRVVFMVLKSSFGPQTCKPGA